MKSLTMLAALVLLSSCGIKSATEEMLQEVKKTNEGIHKQTLSGSYNALRSPDNTGSLNPPSLMYAPATVFAEEASTSELIKSFYTLVADALYGYEANDLRARARQVSITAAQAIAAFTPQEKFEQLLHEQIDAGGSYKEWTYVFAICRYTFIHDYLFKSKLDSTTYMTPALVKELADRFGYLKSIAALPYRDRLKLTVPKILASGVDKAGKPTYQDVPLAIDLDTLVQEGANAASTIEDALTPGEKASAEVKTQLARFR